MPGFPIALRIQRCCHAVELNKLFKRLVTGSSSHHMIIILGQGEKADAVITIVKLPHKIP